MNIIFEDDNNNTNIRFISIILLTFWMILLPVSFFYIYRNKNNLTKFIKIEKIFGFLFLEYKKKLLYWEVLKTVIIKFFLIIVIELSE